MSHSAFWPSALAAGRKAGGPPHGRRRDRRRLIGESFQARQVFFTAHEKGPKRIRRISEDFFPTHPRTKYLNPLYSGTKDSPGLMFIKGPGSTGAPS